MRVCQALNSRVPAAANYTLNVGEYMYVFRETNRTFHGPYRIIAVEDKQVFFLVGNKPVQQSIAQCVPVHVIDKDEPPPGHAQGDAAQRSESTATACISTSPCNLSLIHI